ncbi:TetR/AcrR family transcriptional regulator [Pseudomaricurvus alkylphenolicus]|uniref:TetR/AcrR family transcriptional regulator n=1 Tax=Pseudomaricurvus alkylphenolicus TaxID=1306991 RepID=UPI0014204D05|nr:TetR/AcrR family transcriptional regulator [Pseudomaricurvus alkylphenolicus]NIB44989.1 TetR/AcrR family transcriptional regulator [Pseudomaricurvus alkylphenolicus]
MGSAAKSDTKSKKNDRVTRDKILSAAEELFAQNGYAATSISKIAKKAGVLSGSIYWIFDSKDAIFSAVLINSSEQWKQIGEDRDSLYGTEPHDLDEVEERMAKSLYVLKESPTFVKLIHVAVVEDKTENAEVRDALRSLRSGWTQEIEKDLVAMFTQLPEKHVRAIARRYARLLMAIADGIFIRSAVEATKSGLKEMCATAAKSVVAGIKVEIEALENS